MENFINKKVLVTTEGWFYGKDGKTYRAIYGTLKAIHQAEKVVGFTPSRGNVNWFYEIGNMVIMGCQIMYIVQADEVHTGSTKDHRFAPDSSLSICDRPTEIYMAD